MQSEIKVPKKAQMLERHLFNLLNGEFGIDDGGLREEALHLFENGNEDLGFHYPELMVQLMAISSHPAVQELLPQYTKLTLGKHLQKMYDFFKCLDQKSFYLYLAYIRVKDYGYCLSDDELNQIHQRHIKE